MEVRKKFCRVFALVILLVGCVSSARAQADCMYGHRIYIRDSSGNSITSAKLEVFGVSKRDRLPNAFQNYFTRGAYFVGFIMYGCAYSGDFVLRVSAEGFQTYERPISFTEGLAACELRLRPKGSTMQADFEILATLRGKVVDQKGRPFSGGQISARNVHGKVYQDNSNEYGYYSLDLPKGTYTVRLSGTEIAPVVFENYRIEDRDTTLNFSTCRKCTPAK